MTLTEKIKSNPYFNPSNCTDLKDVDNAIKEILLLEDKHGKHKMIDTVFNRLKNRKEDLS